MSSSFIEANKAVVESLFSLGTNWEEQEAGTTATNGPPSLATDGVDIGQKAGYAVQVVDTAGGADFDIQVWGYANDNWTKINSGLYESLDEGGICEVGIGGVFDSIYVEISRYASGTLTINVGAANS